MALPDLRVTVYTPTMSSVLAPDASSDIGRADLKYSDSPDGSNAAASIPLILTYEDVPARGYWQEWRIVEISSGDNVLVSNAPVLSAGNVQKYYLDTNWGFDPRIWMDDQVAYFWDTTNLTQRCPVKSIGFDGAPAVVESTSAAIASGTSLTFSIPTPAAGNALVLIFTADPAIAVAPSGSWTTLADGSTSSLGIAISTKTATGTETSITLSSTSSGAISATVLEISGAGTIAATVDVSQSGALLWSPPSASPAIGALAISAFASANAAGCSTPRGWTPQSNPATVSTTTTEAITASASLQTITVASTTGLAVGEPATIGSGSQQESVTLTAVGSGSIQGLFANNHVSGAPVVAVASSTNALAVFTAPCTDTATLAAAVGFNVPPTTTPAGATATITVGLALGATPLPWIKCGTSMNGGGTPAYAAGITIVGRRRYSGVVQRRQRVNEKLASATVTLTGMAEYLNRAVGNFAFTTGQNIDIGTAVFSILNLFASDWPFFKLDQRNFPQLGQTYDGTFTASTASSALSSILKAIASGDGWYLRIGHDFTPRLIPLYRDATDTYVANVTLQQTDPPQAATLTVTDCDVTQMYNRILVTGDTDPVSGVAVSAEVVDEDSFAYYGLYFDGQPVQVQGLKTTAECANYGRSLLDQNSLAASANVLTVYTRYNPAAGVTLPGKMLQGDVLPPCAHLTATGFTASTLDGETPPDVSGLASVVVSTISCDDTNGTNTYQTANFQAMMPDWLAALAESANATANALATNTAAAAGIDQYFVDATAYPPSISGFTVTVPSFPAVFAQGSAPVQVGGNSFTVNPNVMSRAWLNPDNTWTIVTDGSIVAGAIPYLFVQSNAAGIVGTIECAQVGLLNIPASYLIEGSLVVPTLVGPSGSGSPTFAFAGQGLQISQITVAFECTNQPTDGSAVNAILYYRKAGQPTWLQFATSPMRNTTVGSDGQGEILTGGAVSASGLYVWIYPDAANGAEYEFGFAIASNRGSESPVVSVGFVSPLVSVPSGATIAVTWSVNDSVAGSLDSISIEADYTISGTTDTSWISSFALQVSVDGRAYTNLPPLVSTQLAQPTLTGIALFSLVLPANYPGTAPQFRFHFKLVVLPPIIAAPFYTSNALQSSSYAYTHA